MQPCCPVPFRIKTINSSSHNCLLSFCFDFYPFEYCGSWPVQLSVAVYLYLYFVSILTSAAMWLVVPVKLVTKQTFLSIVDVFLFLSIYISTYFCIWPVQLSDWWWWRVKLVTRQTARAGACRHSLLSLPVFLFLPISICTYVCGCILYFISMYFYFFLFLFLFMFVVVGMPSAALGCVSSPLYGYAFYSSVSITLLSNNTV